MSGPAFYQTAAALPLPRARGVRWKLSTVALLALLALPVCGRCAAGKGDALLEKRVARPIITTELDGAGLDCLTQAGPLAAFIATASQQANARAVTPEVRALAEKLEKSAVLLVGDLNTLAARKQVPAAKEVDGTGRKSLQALGRLEGGKLDLAYLEDVAGRQAQLRGVLAQGAQSTDKEVRDFATARLPLVKGEADAVKRLSGE